MTTINGDIKVLGKTSHAVIATPGYSTLWYDNNDLLDPRWVAQLENGTPKKFAFLDDIANLIDVTTITGKPGYDMSLLISSGQQLLFDNSSGVPFGGFDPLIPRLWVGQHDSLIDVASLYGMQPPILLASKSVDAWVTAAIENGNIGANVGVALLLLEDALNGVILGWQGTHNNSPTLPFGRQGSAHLIVRGSVNGLNIGLTEALQSINLYTNSISRLSISDTALTATVPLAMSGFQITFLADGILNTDAATYGQLLGHSNRTDNPHNVTWSQVVNNPTPSSLADLAVRSAADLSSGELDDARLSSNIVMYSRDVGVADGVCPLDGSGLVPVANLPLSVIEYQGAWDANTNTPYLHNGIGTSGNFYISNSLGTVDFGAGPLMFESGDWAIYDGSVWQQVHNGLNVDSVNGYTGVVVLTTSDIGEGTHLYWTQTRFDNAFSAALTASNVTTQGNTFNGIDQLVQLNHFGQLPALDGGLLTGVLLLSNGLSQTVNHDIDLGDNQLTTVNTLSGNSYGPLFISAAAGQVVQIQNALDMNVHQIHRVVDPSVDQDAATKKYVDDSISNINLSSTYLKLDGTNSMTGNIKWATDGSSDIGSPDGGTTLKRPRDIYASGNIYMTAPASFGSQNVLDMIGGAGNGAFSNGRIQVTQWLGAIAGGANGLPGIYFQGTYSGTQWAAIAFAANTNDVSINYSTGAQFNFNQSGVFRLAASGSSSAPALSLGGYPGVGVYAASSTTVGLTGGGSNTALQVSNTGAVSTHGSLLFLTAFSNIGANGSNAPRDIYASNNMYALGFQGSPATSASSTGGIAFVRGGDQTNTLATGNAGMCRVQGGIVSSPGATSASGGNLSVAGSTVTGGTGLPGSILFHTQVGANGTSLVQVGSIVSSGLWTIGASGDTQTHVVNGNLSISKTLQLVNQTSVDSAVAGSLLIEGTGGVAGYSMYIDMSTAPTNGQALAYNSGSGQWTPQTISGGTAFPPVGNLDMGGYKFINMLGFDGPAAQDIQITPAAGTSEVQFVTFSAVPTGGTWTINVNYTYPVWPYNGSGGYSVTFNGTDNAATIQTKILAGAPFLSSNGVVVVGNYSIGFTFTFNFALGNVPQMGPTSTGSLTPPGITASVSTTVTGVIGKALLLGNSDLQYNIGSSSAGRPFYIYAKALELGTRAGEFGQISFGPTQQAYIVSDFSSAGTLLLGGTSVIIGSNYQFTVSTAGVTFLSDTLYQDSTYDIGYYNAGSSFQRPRHVYAKTSIRIGTKSGDNSGYLVFGDKSTISSAIANQLIIEGQGGVSGAVMHLDLSTAPTDGQVLTYQSSSTKWIPKNNSKIYSAYITAGGSPTATQKYPASWIDSVVQNSTGNYTINLTSGIFTNAPNAVITVQYNGAVIPVYYVRGTPSTSSITIQIEDNAGAAQDWDFMIMAQGT